MSNDANACLIPTITGPKIITKEVTASWYGQKFHGRQMANGKRFNMYKASAAHKKLPFGKEVLLENLENGQALIITIQDRGPAIQGRDFDVSYAAAKKLGFMKKGLAKLRASYIAEE